MTILTRRRAIMAASLGAVAVPFGRDARAHHGWGSYDSANPLTLTGSVQRSSYQQPHALIWLAAEDAKVWEVWLAPPSRMRARGVTAEMIEPGAKVQAYGYPSREHEAELRAEWIKIADATYQLR